MPFLLDSAPPSKSLPVACRAVACLNLRRRLGARLLSGAVVGALALSTTGVANTTPATAHSGALRATDLPVWSWPVPDPHPVVREFEAPDEVWSPGHRGIDIEAADATVVTAPDSGVVHFAGQVVDRPVVSIEHAGGILSSFEPVVASVAAGDTIERGQEIGTLQSGHDDCGTCLHLGARIDGDYVNPLLLLGELRPAILLPTRR
ncbi:MAG: hypothetical protein JWP75_759 [Frondihabitans sp.]|nr:hypothetical protein [Frondihabitans sp.]